MNLPVVKQGEEINAWLSRSVPALVEMHSLNTEQANRLAKQAWNQINGGSDLVAQMTGADAPTFNDESSWGESVVNGDAWPSTASPTDGDQWPDPFSQADFDALVSPTTDATTAPTTDATTAPATDATTAPTATAPTAVDGVAALLSTLNQLTAIVSGLQGIADVIAKTEARKPIPDAAEADAEEADTEEADVAEADVAEADVAEADAEEADTEEADTEEADTEEADIPANPFSAGKPNAPAKNKKPFKGNDFLAVGAVPTSGYVVAVAPDRSRILPDRLISEKSIKSFMAQNSDLWSAGNWMGGRRDEKTGDITLSAFRHVDTEAKAIQHCSILGADSFFNLSTGEFETVPAAKSLAWVDENGMQGPNLIRRLGDYRDPGGLTVKSLEQDRFGGYLCLWGDPATKDLSGEWFTRNTEGLRSVFDVLGKLPAFYHHAGNDVVKSAVVGLIDEMEEDDAGLWVEAQARLSKAYRQYVLPLIEQQSLGWSSGALPRARRVAKSGEIKRWPIIEGSLTPTPFEWRNLTDWPVERITKAYEMAGINVSDDFLWKGRKDDSQ